MAKQEPMPIPTLPAREVLLPAPGSTVDEMAELQFFRGLRLANGTYKATAPARMEDLDALVQLHLSAQGPLRVLDAAASTGITSLEWLDRMEAGGRRVKMTVVDLAISAWLRRIGPFEILVDRSGTVLQVALGRRTAFRSESRGRRRLRSQTGRLLFTILQSMVPRAPAEDRRATPVSLVSPRLVERVGVTVVERDLSAPLVDWAHQFSVVRAANFLNREYFSDVELACFLHNLAGTVVPGGLLVLCRTEDEGRNTASIIRIPAPPATSPTVLARLNGGSEVETLAMEILQNREPA